MMFAQGLPDFGLGQSVLEIVRVIASVGGAVVGWFLCDPLTRIGYRLSFKGATPSPLLLVVKGAGAATLAVLIYVFIPLGGDGSGLGFGPGEGGGPGKGKGPGGDKVAVDGAGKDKKPAGKDKDDKRKSEKLESVQIEILGGEKFVDDGKNRYYLLERKPPPLALDEIEEYLKKREGKIQVTAVLTKDTGIGMELIGSPLDQLRTTAKKYNIKVLTDREE